MELSQANTPDQRLSYQLFKKPPSLVFTRLLAIDYLAANEDHRLNSFSNSSGGVMRRSVLILALCVASGLIAAARQTTQPWPPVATFSILGFDPDTGEVGGAVQSRVFSVGNGVLWAEAGVGAAASQAIVDVSYGPKAISLLRAGMKPEAIIKAIWESDPDPQPQRWTKEGRQFAVIDQQGNTAVYTGPKATEWAGHQQGKFCTAQGNILAGQAVVDGMVKAFESTTGHLSKRLTAALEAG